MLNFYMPVRLFAGEGCVEAHKSEFLKLGSSCLIVTGKSSAKKCGALDDAVHALESLDIAWSLYDGVTQNPTVAVCREAGELAHTRGAQFLLGIGGGSAMDASKAAAVFAANPGMDESGFYAAKWENGPLPIALIGTSAGTGSEVTDVAVLTDSRARKHSLHDPRMYAAVSFGDPAYTASLPRAVTLSTAADALAHCAESFLSKKANEASRAAAVRGIRLLLPALRTAAEGRELTADTRRSLYEASLLGGLAINVTGTGFPHNIGYYLTENYHVPHGVACATFFEDLLTHCEECAPDCTGELYASVGADRDELTGLVKLCLPELPIRMTEREIEDALPRRENNGTVKNTLGTVTTDEIRRIFTEKFVK